MKCFIEWGVKSRQFPEYNYRAVWCDNKTIRFGKGQALPLPPNKSEFYDISLGRKCNLQCPFCYTDAKKDAQFYTNVVDKANFFFGQMDRKDRPFQVAIGSEGEPTIHPEFTEFLEALFALNVVPNYTTNGITIAADTEQSDKILEATSKFVGGVALSANTWNKTINDTWRKAFEKLSLKGNTNINIHYIIKDKKSVDDFVKIHDEYKDRVLYFVLLPLMNSGRSLEKYQKEAFDYLLSKTGLNWNKIAFGAHFYDLLKAQNTIKCWLYPPESFSKNLILDDVIKITPSSFDLNPLIEYEWKNV